MMKRMLLVSSPRGTDSTDNRVFKSPLGHQYVSYVAHQRNGGQACLTTVDNLAPPCLALLSVMGAARAPQWFPVARQ